MWCVCVCVQLCDTYIYVCVYVYLLRPEADIRDLSSLLSTLFTDGRSLIEPGTKQSFLACLASLQSRPLEPGLQAATMPAWLLWGSRL